MRLIDRVIWGFACHMIGDYVLQSDFIAKTKGENWYHMIVHCVLYCVPFVVVFGLTEHIAFLFATHVVIDSAKARWDAIDYCGDQMLHYKAILLCLAVGMGV